jgi:AcrR family transcriptional regulator
MPLTQTAPSLRERRRKATRRDLVSATLAIITEDGLDAATVDRISRRAGMARATLYAHFPDGRDSLLAAAYATLGDRLVESTLSAARHGDPRTRLTGVVGAMIELAGEPRLGHFYNVSGPALVATDTVRGTGSGATRDLVASILAEATGRTAADEDVVAEAAQLTGALRQVGQDVASGAVSAQAHQAAFERMVAGLLNTH